jgi:hypothetical protein
VSDARYALWRHQLADGEETTLYAIRHPVERLRVRVVHFPRPQRLDVWCAREGVGEAIVGGFFMRDPYRALGELWVAGEPVSHEPVASPYGRVRACVISDERGVRFGPVEPSPRGDIVQAGPLLVTGGAVVFDPAVDREGFSDGAGQFDSDITDGAIPAPPSESATPA